MLRALISGQKTDPQQLAALGDSRLRATPEQLQRALDGRLAPVHRLLLGQLLGQIELLEDHMAQIDQ